MVKGINYEIFGDDSTRTISLNNFMAGFIDATKNKQGIMSMEEATSTVENLMQTLKAKVMEEKYGDWKKQCEDYMAKIARRKASRSWATASTTKC